MINKFSSLIKKIIQCFQMMQANQVYIIQNQNHIIIQSSQQKASKGHVAFKQGGHSHINHRMMDWAGTCDVEVATSLTRPVGVTCAWLSWPNCQLPHSPWNSILLCTFKIRFKAIHHASLHMVSFLNASIYMTGISFIIRTVNISGPRAALQWRRRKCGWLTGRVGYRFLSPVHH